MDYQNNLKQIVLPAGTLLFGKKYRLLDVIGSGGFGITYKAVRTDTEKLITVKELFPKDKAFRARDRKTVVVEAENQEFFAYLKDRFFQEAETMKKVSAYPEMLQVYEVFEENETVYYSMEFLQGENLQQYLARKKKLSWDELQPIVMSVLYSLEILHSKGYIHRDISPDNIFLLEDQGRILGAKLIDFGSARDSKSDHFSTIFKPTFAALEMFKEKSKQGPYTDIFSVCGTIYYCLSGGKLPENTIERVTHCTTNQTDILKPIQYYKPHAPQAICQVINQGLSLYARNRYPNIAEFRNALIGKIPGNTSVAEAVHPGKVCVQLHDKGDARTYPIVSDTRILIGQDGEKMNREDVDRTRILCQIMLDKKGKFFVMKGDSRLQLQLNGHMIQSGYWYYLKESYTVSNDKVQIQCRMGE